MGGPSPELGNPELDRRRLAAIARALRNSVLVQYFGDLACSLRASPIPRPQEWTR